MTRPEMTTGQFWAAALERAVKTAAQVAAALIGTGAVGMTELDWQQIGSVALTAAIVSVLTSLASDRIGTPGPSLVGEAPVVKVAVNAGLSEPDGPEGPAVVTLTPERPTTPAVYPLSFAADPAAPDTWTGYGGPGAADEAELAARRNGGTA